MDFLAATKEGLFIMDAANVKKDWDDGEPDWKTGKAADGTVVKVVAKLPSPSNAFGHSWSPDGDILASVVDEGVRLYDATNHYKSLMLIEKVAPDVGGRQGGVRSIMFSPFSNFVVLYEKWDPQFPENVHVWAISGDRKGKKLYSCTLKGYTSGALPVQIIKWTPDEAFAVEMLPGKGLALRKPDFSDTDEARLIPEKYCANFVLSPLSATEGSFVCLYSPEALTGSVGKITVYDLSKPDKRTFEFMLPGKVKDASIAWNFDASAAVVNASSDVDETGCSYFGTTYMYWFKPDSKVPSSIYGSKDGQVQDFAWSPNTNEFAAIVGFQPATVNVHDGKTGKISAELGKSRRNTIKWNPFGRFMAVGGFGTLAGDLDFFDKSSGETIASLRAPLTVDCSFGPDGRSFLSSTLAPRMNEGNQISLFKYTGELLFRLDYVPEVVDARHEDTGAGARTKTQALLFATSWRPKGKKEYEDRAASPPKNGGKRKKGLPDAADEQKKAPVMAYKPRGASTADGSSVSAMMRGEIPTPAAAGGWGDDPKAPTLAPMEEWEIKKLQKEANKAAEKREKEDKEAAVAARKNADKAERSDKKKLKELKEKLAQLDSLKEKEWDELTDEDEEQLEGEVDLRAEILELEKSVGDS